MAALAEPAWVGSGRAHNAAQRAQAGRGAGGRGHQGLAERGQFRAGRLRHPGAADAADAALRRRGIIVRAMRAYGLPHCLRITVGTAEECGLVAEALAAARSPTGRCLNRLSAASPCSASA